MKGIFCSAAGIYFRLPGLVQNMTAFGVQKLQVGSTPLKRPLIIVVDDYFFTFGDWSTLRNNTTFS